MSSSREAKTQSPSTRSAAPDVKTTYEAVQRFLLIGRNPLLVFVLSGLLAKTLGLVKVAAASGRAITLHSWIYGAGFSWIGDPTLRSHAFALVTILFWWAVLKVFEKKGWYWTV